MARSLATLIAAAALTGCGANGMQGAPLDGATPQVASGWTSVKVAPHGFEPCLVARKAGGYAIAYATDKLGDRHVYFTASPDGDRWTPPVAVAKGPLSDEAPALCEDASGELHLFFGSNRDARYAVYEATSTDGQAWSAPEALSAEIKDDQDGNFPSIAPLPSGGLAIAYETYSGIRFRTRSAKGEWSSGETVATTAGAPALAAGPDGRITLAYMAYQKLYVRSRSTVGAWTAPTALAGGPCETPALTSDGQGGLWMVHTQQTGEFWNLAERTFTGGRWGEAIALTLGQTDDQAPSALLLPGAKRAVAWGSSKDGRASGLYFARSQ
ncbi:MAG TPA: hypothetical protein V6D00_08025 [Pantanalinema sp.]